MGSFIATRQELQSPPHHVRKRRRLSGSRVDAIRAFVWSRVLLGRRVHGMNFGRSINNDL